MKRIIALVVAVFVVFNCGACGKNSNENVKQVEPDESQLKAICELATLECYYRNVAKSVEEDGQGMLWWKEDKILWIEYSGVVSLGIDASCVRMTVEENIVTISIPDGKVLDVSVDELKAENYLTNSDETIGADAQVAAIKAAEEDMRTSAENNTTLLSNAQQRAKELLENYIKNIGTMSGVEYEIEWIYIDEVTE